MPLPADDPPRDADPSPRRLERLARAVADAAASADPALPRVVADLEAAADLPLPHGLPEQSPIPLARRIARLLRHARPTPLTDADVEDALTGLAGTTSEPARAEARAPAVEGAPATAGEGHGVGGRVGVQAP